MKECYNDAEKIKKKVKDQIKYLKEGLKQNLYPIENDIYLAYIDHCAVGQKIRTLWEDKI